MSFISLLLECMLAVILNALLVKCKIISLLCDKRGQQQFLHGRGDQKKKKNQDDTKYDSLVSQINCLQLFPLESRFDDYQAVVMANTKRIRPPTHSHTLAQL